MGYPLGCMSVDDNCVIFMELMFGECEKVTSIRFMQEAANAALRVPQWIEIEVMVQTFFGRNTGHWKNYS